eukprot:1345975-Prymnesium_polylepis.1
MAHASAHDTSDMGRKGGASHSTRFAISSARITGSRAKSMAKPHPGEACCGRRTSTGSEDRISNHSLAGVQCFRL